MPSVRRLSAIFALLGLVLIGTSSVAARAAGLDGAEWIWSPKYEPGKAPVGAVYFRKTVELTAADTARVEITCDNAYELFINGQSVGKGQAWERVDTHQVKDFLKAGTNTIAVKGDNTDEGWAGLIAKLIVNGKDGKRVAVVTDATWKTSVDAAAGWEKPSFDDAKWAPARSFGPYGTTQPWGNKPTHEPEIQGARFTAPAGFKVEKVLGDQAGSLVAMAFNEDGDLLVSKEGHEIYLVRNFKDGAETATASVYCSRVTNCQGILAHQGHVYAVGNGPEGSGLYRLTDTTGNGRADKVETLLIFNGGMQEHGPHQPIIGPDGLLYLVVGNLVKFRGTFAPSSPVHDTYEADLVQPRYEDANGFARGVKSPGGIVIRTDLDAKYPELFAAGFRNAYDIAFNRQGELFTFDADMEWDENLPWYRPIRVNHVIPGGEYGWRSGWLKWPDYYLDSIGSVFDVGRGSPTGLVFYNHTAYPAAYRDAFFMCDWSRGRILVAHCDPAGATFKGKFETFIEGQPLNVTDAEVGPDGALYFSAGGRGTQGAVFRAVWTGKSDQNQAVDKGIWQAIHQPQMQSAWARANVAKIRAALGEKWGPELRAVAVDEKASTDDRTQAIDLLQLFGPAPETALLVKLAADGELPIRAKATFLLGLHRDAESAKQLIALLDDRQPLVRRLACESLVRSEQAVPLEKVIRLLADDDRTVEFAARLLLERMPIENWRKAILTADTTRAYLVGSVALAKMAGDRLTTDAILARANLLLDGSLNDADRLDLLRVIELALCRSRQEGDQLPELRGKLSKLFPLADWRANRELVRLLVYLQDPTLAPRLVAELNGKSPVMEKIHMAMYARFLQPGWTTDSRDKLLKFYESTQPMQGGHSFHGYIANAASDFIKSMSTTEQFARLADGAKEPTVTLQLVRNLPDALSTEQLAALRKLDRDLAGDRRQEARELAAEVLVRLGKSADEPTLAYLHATFESSPERRPDVAEAIALFAMGRQLRPADRDLLVQSLPVVEGSTARDVLRALVKFNAIVAKPEELRQVILVGLKLKDQGGTDAVALLELWTKTHASQPGDSATAALAAWQKWFVKTYPDQPEPKLPVGSSQDKFTYAQIMKYLDSDQGRQASAARGAAVFEKALCIKCHKFGNRGEGVGPDLTTVSRRFQRKEILESVLYPSAVISDQFASKTVITTDGRTFTGIVGPTADGVSVMQSDLKRVQIAQKDIDQIIPSKVSAMPERLFNALTLEEIADLFAYLGKVPE